MAKLGRPATGRNYKTISAQVTAEQLRIIAAMAEGQTRSTAFVIRVLITLGIASSQQPDCGSGCTCRQ